jgi:hypothetical protein
MPNWSLNQGRSMEYDLEWVEVTLTRLYMGKIGLVLGGLWNRRTNLSATSV